MATIILCIGSAEDSHIQEVEKNVKLLDNDARIVLFNPLCGGHFIEITVDSSCELSSSCLIVVDGERIPAESIKSVWYRWKPAVLSADEDLQGMDLAKNFASIFLYSFLYANLMKICIHFSWCKIMRAL